MENNQNEEKLLHSVALQNARAIQLAREQAAAVRSTLAAIVESSDDAIISKDLNGVIISWNQGAERLFGYTATEAIGRHITILIPPDRLDEEAGILRRIRSGEPIKHYETIRRHKSGKLVDISLSVAPVRDAHGQIIGGSKIARDISDRRLAERGLARLAAIVESSQDAIISEDLNGVILTWNQGAERLFGYAADEIIGKPITLLMPRERQHEEAEILAGIRQGRRIEHFETIRCRKDGALVEISLTVSPVRDEQGVVIGVSKIARDITSRRRMERQLARLNETLVSVMKSLPVAVMVADAESKIEFKNPAALVLCNALGLNDGLPAPIQAELDRVLHTGEHWLPTDFKAVHPFILGGEERFFLSRIVAMSTPEKTVFGAVVMLQDVTEFRLLDKVKSNLVATVSHELKTPLTSLQTALFVLFEQTLGTLNGRQLEMVTVAQEGTARLLRTLDALLDLTRFEQDGLGLRRERVFPEELIRAAVDATQDFASSVALTVKLEVGPGLPAIDADREHILHVLTNFLTNAIKYSHAGGEIIVQARLQGEEIYFGVKDQGPGVPLEFHSRIFEKFFRVPGTQKTGAGLGLSIARDFVRAHHGKIGVRSDSGPGSEFYFTLPVASENYFAASR